MSLLSRLAIQAARAYGILSSKSTNVSTDYLVVAGGGSGGGGNDGSGGGGGAGGYLTSTVTLSTLNTYSIVVGAGAATTATSSKGANGSNSSLSGTGITTVTSIGGGAGGYNAANQANTGGSGGGQGGKQSSGNTTGTTGQGSSGGYGYNVSLNWTGGGGGGAGGNGGNGASGLSGAGGAGSASSISGTSITRASGGSGGAWNSGQASGATAGGGGAGGGGVVAGGNATVNTGGGGGGGGQDSLGGAGGSGIVIISYTSATPKFVGGTITTSGGKQIHTFTSSGTLSPITPITASYLVVAGGGGGGTPNISIYYGGGGGGGGLLTSSTTLYSGATYVVTVGAGGAVNTNGSDSIVSGTGLTTVTSTGGGKGGAFQTNGTAGGSGGGAGGDGSGVARTGGTGNSGQGNNGGGAGAAGGSTNTGAGGGGGAGAAGTTSSTKNGAAGGAGLANSLSGSSVTYAAGGGGQRGSDGTDGTDGANGTGWVSAPNLGHGGAASVQRAGSSGIVIISYAGSQVFNGGLVTTSGGNTIHTFTSTGALTPLTNNLNNSLRFRSSASAYLSRTPASAGNRRTWTWSAWVKRGLMPNDTSQYSMLSSGGSGGDAIMFSDGNKFTVNIGLLGINAGVIPTQVQRDPSAWYHLVVAIDTAQATASNRVKMYVNGVQITSFSTTNYPSQNTDTTINSTTVQDIGRQTTYGNYFDGYMADVNFIDGQALEPYYFGNNDANGVWKPILYKGTYGTNGFYLTFGNTTSTTTLGYDSSPNGNNWTCNNISLTAGTTYDAMTDVPTNTSATVANYAVVNPIFTRTPNVTISYANLRISTSAAADSYFSGTMGTGTSGKYYYEMTYTSAGNAILVGVQSNPTTGNANGGTYRSNTGTIYNLDGTTATTGATFTTGDIIGVAINVDSGSVTFYKNNVSQGSFSFTAGTEMFMFGRTNGTGSETADFNFGQRPFTYTPPTGFVRLNTFNLPTPTILQGNKYMDATLYTGTGTTQVVVNQAQFKPDLVWVKVRSTTGTHVLTDSNRGANKQLFSNLSNAEATATNKITGFSSNGFTLGADDGSGTGDANFNGSTYVGWQWQAGQGSTSSGTGTGGITSVTQSVNTTAGFSVVTYTGSGANGTVTHGLGVAPKMIIVKWRSGGGLTAQDWNVYHTSVGATARLFLNTTAASATTSVAWNNTAPTSSVFSIGTGTDVNGNGAAYVAYCWAEIAGFSAFGSYTGNGSTDGAFVYTGFRPKWIMLKRTDAANIWLIGDSRRDGYNSANPSANKQLQAQATNAESNFDIDYLSNGFKLRNIDSYLNASGGTYIYMAFAENPFKNSNAR